MERKQKKFKKKKGAKETDKMMYSHNESNFFFFFFFLKHEEAVDSTCQEMWLFTTAFWLCSFVTNELTSWPVE